MKSRWRDDEAEAMVTRYAQQGIGRDLALRVYTSRLLGHIWSPKKGERMGTVKQIEKMVRIAKELGREVATGDDARRIMKIGTWYNSPAETLSNLGLPPNRKEGHLGFLVHETDGKHHAPALASDSHPLAE